MYGSDWNYPKLLTVFYLVCKRPNRVFAMQILTFLFFLTGYPYHPHCVPTPVCQELDSVESCDLCDYEPNGKMLLKEHKLTLHFITVPICCKGAHGPIELVAGEAGGQGP